MKHRRCRGRAPLAGLLLALVLWGMLLPARAWSEQPGFDTKNLTWLFGGAPLFHADGIGVLLESGLLMPLGKFLPLPVSVGGSLALQGAWGEGQGEFDVMGSLLVRGDIWSRPIKKESFVPKLFGFFTKTKKAPPVQAGFSAQFAAGGGLINYWLLPSPGYVPLGGAFLRLGGGGFMAVDTVRVDIDLCYQFEFTTAGQRGYVLVPLSVCVPFAQGSGRKK